MFKSPHTNLWQPLFKGMARCCRTTPARSYHQHPFSYDDHYYGWFDYHDHNKYPRRMSYNKQVSLLEEVHNVVDNPVVQPSPFHVVRRYKPMAGQRFDVKVILRRLNLHSQAKTEFTIVPNTPQFNDMLYRVKHLIQLKPAVFANGSYPREEDIGALTICPFTGNISVDEKTRLLANRLNEGKPELFRGNVLRAKINEKYGLTSNHFIRW